MCAIFSFLVGNTKKYRKELVFSYNFIKFALNNSGQTQNSIHLKINMEFNYNQKISMMRVLLDIIFADCKVDYRETELFKVLQQEFELSNDDLKNLNERSAIISLMDIKELDDEQKKYFAHLMDKTIKIDGIIDKREVAIYDVVLDYCNIPIPFSEESLCQ